MFFPSMRSTRPAKRLSCFFPGLLLALAHAVGCTSAGLAEPARFLEPDRRFDVIPSPPWPGGQGEALAFAGRALAGWEIQLAGVTLDGPRLVALAAQKGPGPMEVKVREGLGRPVDLEDFIFFLDDVLRLGGSGRRGEVVWVTPGRARSAGILLHPDDVFGGSPRVYGSQGPLSIDPPRPQLNLPPAGDGDPPGPGWAARYRNPSQEAESLAALEGYPGGEAFAGRVGSLISQLREQGAEVYLNSTVRSRERGYLMWGAFLLGHASGEADLQAGLRQLEEARSEWGLSVPIDWHAWDDWERTRDAAREMAETYEVVFATREGARASDHYAGRAVDLVALALPRRLVLRAPGGGLGRFDLSGSDESRDLSLSPELIDWVEANFGLRKLRADYPHWSNTR
ncbi:MAG: hypothetical protein NZ990_11395 [Myxococcota bacterium]|nr:hypothetical protein [Myxococcota bacterium]